MCQSLNNNEIKLVVIMVETDLPTHGRHNPIGSMLPQFLPWILLQYIIVDL